MELRKMSVGAVVVILASLSGCGDGDDNPEVSIVVPPQEMTALPMEGEDPPVTTTDAGVSSWEFLDECDDNADMNAKFHEFADGSPTGFFWPAETDEVLPFSGSGLFNLRCDVDQLICYGVEADDGNGFFWGVRIDGSESCENCCSFCGDEPRSISLTC
ncbi:MAG: hypothetical protein AB8B97_01995 [Granulosicoccus sp.]